MSIVPFVTLLQEAASGMDATSLPVAEPAAAARGLRHLIMAYTVVWVILGAYMVTLSVRLHRLAARIRRLKDRPAER